MSKFIKAYTDETESCSRPCADRGMRLEFRGTKFQLNELVRILGFGLSELHGTSPEMTMFITQFASNHDH